MVVEEAHKILKILGIDERYLKLNWISASEGKIFAEQIRSFTGLLKELGPSALARTDAPEKSGESPGLMRSGRLSSLVDSERNEP